VGEPLEKVIVKIAERHNQEKGMHNAIQFVLFACHGIALHYRRLTDYITL
jgi:hypothetical protein